MKSNKINHPKMPIIKIEKPLNQFEGKVFFKKKLENANKTLKRVGPPKLGLIG